MENETVTVVARIQAKPGKEAELRGELQKLLAPTHAEEGCISYDMHDSLDDPGLFLFYESWTTRKAIDRHLGSAHVQNLLSRADQLLAQPVELTFWRRVE